MNGVLDAQRSSRPARYPAVALGLLACLIADSVRGFVGAGS